MARQVRPGLPGPVPRGPVLAAAAGLVVLLLAATGLQLAGADDGSPTPPSSASSSSASLPSAVADPVVLSDCWVPAPGGNLALTVAEAERLTDRAARVSRRGGGPALLVEPVRAATGTTRATARSAAEALLGWRGAKGLVCSPVRSSVDPEKMGRSGLTPRAARLRRAFTASFGALPAGGFASGGVSTGHVDNSAHYEGRAMDVFFRPLGSVTQRRAGWVFAQWLVAHAQRYHVLSAIYDDHIWTSWAASLGWRDYQHPGGPTRNPVLRHLDHVHVAVESGRRFGFGPR
jgi:hypothetical protein